MKSSKELLLEIAENQELLEVARLEIEDTLVEFRDSRIFQLRNNGLVIKEKDGSESHIIRLGFEQAFAIALKKVAESLDLVKNLKVIK